MKIALILLALVTAFLGVRVLQLDSELRQLQVNTAIAVLSAEAANNKVGAIAPFFSQLLRFFPPIVTGTVILIIGLSLMRVAAGWIVDGSEDGAPPINVAFAFGTLLLIVLIERFAPPALQRVSVLLGLVLGTVAALFVPGMVDWTAVGDADWFALVTPFRFGLPTFQVASEALTHRDKHARRDRRTRHRSGSRALAHRPPRARRASRCGAHSAVRALAPVARREVSQPARAQRRAIPRVAGEVHVRRLGL